jgi:hypothetical protein
MNLPSSEHAAVATRVALTPSDSREWTANEDDAGEHHGAVRLNENPCVIHLLWYSKRAGKTVDVGTFKLSPRGLLNGKYSREERPGTVRIRFVRNEDGLVVIQANDAGPALPVGEAHFE